MNPREAGFLLLCSHLGDPSRRIMTPSQFRTLARRVQGASCHCEEKELDQTDLTALGYGPEESDRILALLADDRLLELALEKGRDLGIAPITRISPDYPDLLRRRLGADAPPVLWYRGEPGLLQKPSVGVVGSRMLLPENRYFAMLAGREAARQGFILVSGNAKGADTAAQDACRLEGGTVISIVADSLADKPRESGLLWMCEDSFDFPFSAPRALSRNRIIHALGGCTLVAQCTAEAGGTWDGSLHNLSKNLSPLFCFRDGSEASLLLQDRGAVLIDPEDLQELSALCTPQADLFSIQF